MDENKKLVAATSAVFRYIQQEEEVIHTQPFPATNITGANVLAAKFRLWGLSGRQAQMQMRNLMQMKAFHGTKSSRPI